MKGNEKVIAALNEALKSELTAINQYFLHAEMRHDWGYQGLYQITKKQSIDEMKHAESLIERILFLEGAPNMSELFPIKVGENVKAQFENDLALELEAVARYNASIKLCAEVGDNASRELFVKLLKDEEEHVDFLESQLHLISEVGLERYLTEQIRG
ncbi:MAG TPA: bacterioferritin [Bryobacteraceae bacterium]|nr:bacterioferritin [Bryobacteraceae bacterium]HOQ44729.1 bacterioferritin [Bryobacteraceae bacterium]HPQ15377.1 bacterioferritin [Bryobacteraceae bacterium]HPU71939.1 bacterioferritin [Bryobacteraceae bacterium]